MPSGRATVCFLLGIGVIYVQKCCESSMFIPNLEKPVSWGMPLFLLLFGVMLLMSPRITVKRAFATDRLLSEPITGEADEQGVRMETAHGGVDLPWALTHKVVISANVVTIY